ncbi:MAG: hypothetical protein ACE5JR_09310 [Gemmatimonadota bacterium]
MKSNSAFLAAAAFFAFSLSGCGGSDLTVQVLQEGAQGAATGVKNHVVFFIPFDRDSLFEALAAQAPEPEPRIPDDLLEAFDRISNLQEEWRQADAAWAEVRDSLQRLSDRLRGMDRRSRQYLQLFRRFTALEGRERQLNRQKQRAFDAFDNLQKAALTRADSVRAVIESWEDVAFADYSDIEADLLEAMEREIYQDTTDADGYVTRRLPGGAWYVHSRLPIPSGELYWNVRVDPRQVDTLRLSRDNGEPRPRL